MLLFENQMEQIYTQAAVYLTGERRSIYLSCGTDLTAEHLPAGYSHHHQPRSRIQDQGSKIKDPRSRIWIQEPGLRLNGCSVGLPPEPG